MKTSLLVMLAVLLYALPSTAQQAPTPSVGPSLEALTPSELDALGLEMAGPRVDTSFHFWGFADFNSSLMMRSIEAAKVAQGRYQNFFVGNLNFYLSKNLSESFRTMAEVRLTYLPNGSYRSGPTGYEQTDTSTIDYANGQSLTRWGGIILQRVYLEWSLHRFLSVRAGQFLSPVGIWNVDHGSPAYIPAQRPLAIVSGLFPERQTGLELLGRWSASNTHTIGYHLTLSNGTGPISEYKDLDRNKAVGGRLYWEYFSELYIRAGFSGYYGRETVTTPTATITADTVDLNDAVGVQYDSLTLAADVLIKYGALRLQAEWLTQQRRYTKAGRTVHAVISGPVANGASADTVSWAGYVLAAYRFGDLYGLTPFATFQTAELPQLNNSLPDTRFEMIGFTAGINVSPIDSVVFKVEYVRIEHPVAPAFLRGKINALLLQAAWAF